MPNSKCCHLVKNVFSQYQSKKEGKDQELIQSSTTPDPGYQWEGDNFTLRIHKRELKVNPFPAGDHKASINRRALKHNKNKTELHKRCTALECSVKYFTGGLNLISWRASLTLISDVDQAT